MLVNGQHTASQDESSILHPSSRALSRFWESIRAENSAAKHSDLDLKLIRPLVPNLYVAEYNVRNRQYHWRLAGTGICDIYRRELTGTNFLAGWDSFETGVISRFLSGVTRNLQPCLLKFRMRTDLDQLIGAELIGLPLLASDHRTVHVFGGLFAFRDIWSLSYGSVSGMELSGARSIWTEHLPGDQLLSQTTETPGNQPFRPFQIITGGRTLK
jgi:hypothetical protein